MRTPARISERAALDEKTADKANAARDLNALAKLYRDQGKLAEAERLERRAREIMSDLEMYEKTRAISQPDKDSRLEKGAADVKDGNRREAAVKKDSFAGRATRPEWWKVFLKMWGLCMVLLGAAMYLGMGRNTYPFPFSPSTVIILFLASVSYAPMYALPVTVRRFHDMDKSGWCSALIIIPIIGGIIAIIWCGLIKGTSGTNRYG